MAEGPEVDDIYINEIPADYEVPFSWENPVLLTDSSTDLTAEFFEQSYDKTASNLPPHPPNRPLPPPPPPPPRQVRPPLPRYDTDYTRYGSSHSVRSVNLSTESLDTYRGIHQSNSRVRLLSSAFNSESRAKIKDAILKGRDYLMTKVQDYQQRIRSNMNNRQRDVLPNNRACETDPHDLGRSDRSQSADVFCSSYKEILPSYEELMQLERPPDTMTDNQNAEQNLVSLNVQHSQEYVSSTNEAQADRAPLLEELPPEEEEESLPEEAADILNQASSLAAAGEDDLPLGIDANTLSGNPSGAALSSHGSEIIDEQPLSSPSLPQHRPPPLLSSQTLPAAGNTHPWLQALSGRQQSFGSDLSTGTNSSVNSNHSGYFNSDQYQILNSCTPKQQARQGSIELLLQGREADPEEILMSLGFGSTEDESALTSRIPPRFLMLNSEARGVSIDDLFGQRSELQELIENWNCQKYSSGQSVNPIHVCKALQFLSANEVPSRYLQPVTGTMLQNLMGVDIEGSGENKSLYELKDDLNRPPPPPLPPPPSSPPLHSPPPHLHHTAASTAITRSPKKDKALRTDADNLKNKSSSPYNSPVRHPVLTDLTLNEEGFDDISWSSESSVTLSSYINLRLAPNESLV